MVAREKPVNVTFAHETPPYSPLEIILLTQLPLLLYSLPECKSKLDISKIRSDVIKQIKST
jgi:hypothetical protein